ncbi:uncharacterized protein E0L32_008679 [Thyridium curvatum]|uniref:Uncharacterized protein n=1 Tax=Thyridium curvatum TaxID=1093900 RepID=A0A507AUU9_9PEZI|nr:uncharacterized protein E0L32_008679 [Thyridium curvatum]TPX10274.1 hypothetical protein E0L32_008679 [Thyridium curvatum]
MEDPYQISLQDSTLSVVNASLSGPAGLTPCQGLELQLGSLTFGIPSMRSLYRDDASHLAKLNPFLMQAILAVTLMHDRLLASSPPPKASAKELFHLGKAVGLFSSTLRQPCALLDKAALWVTAVLLGSATIADADAVSPEDAWPLRSPSEDDLAWLRMSDGKREVWRIARPEAAGHMFQDIFTEKSHAAQHRDTFDRLPPALVSLLDLHTECDAWENPYRHAALTLNALMGLECSQATITKFLAFISQMRPDFRQLLEWKDPRALLIFATWYSKLCHYQQWHIWRRAVLETQAICLYLERYHGDLPHLQELLSFPRQASGMGTVESV